MKNKKGFTLVELLAIIIILGLVVLIAIPEIMNAFNSAKNKISDIEKKHLIDSSEEAVLEIINCDMTITDFNYLFNKNVTTCSEMQELIIGKDIETSVYKLVEKEHFEDKTAKCNGTVIINTDSNYKVTVDTNGVTCNN